MEEDPEVTEEAETFANESTHFFVVADILTEAELVAKYTKHVLDMYGGNKTVAARMLGIDRRSLYRRLGGVPTDVKSGRNVSRKGKPCS